VYTTTDTKTEDTDTHAVNCPGEDKPVDALGLVGQIGMPLGQLMLEEVALLGQLMLVEIAS